MTKAAPDYQACLARRIEQADGLAKRTRAAEYARVRLSIEDFKARNLDDLGPGFFDGMLAELDAARGKAPANPKPSAPEAVGAFD